MSASYQQSVRCLEIYIARGKSALDKLRNGLVNEIDDELKWRKAALSNFRFYDEIARQTQCELREKHPSEFENKLRALWMEARQVDTELNILLQRELEKADKQLKSIRIARSKIRCFHSGAKATRYLNRSI